MLTRRIALLAFLSALLVAVGRAAASEAAAESDYDAHLCRLAQRLLIDADDTDFAVDEQTGYGNGFHVIQMDVDAERRRVVIAMTTEFADVDGARVPTYVSCKMVDRERVNDVLGTGLPGPDRQCRDVNEHTYRRALANLSSAESSRYLATGRPLRFGEDAMLASGGEWLPSTMDTFIDASRDEIVVRSPSVRVPWNSAERNFYQGTQHCKLVTLAAMVRWMRVGAFSESGTLLPSTHHECKAPHSLTSAVGSCRFYFAPADGMFCQDYSGPGWTRAAAAEECARRHASAAALRAAENRYAGAGGVFSPASCAQRDDAVPIDGTCVFHCGQADETLWHIAGAVDPRMTRGCDLFVD